MPEFVKKLLSSDSIPLGYCSSWRPGIVWLHVGSDVAIALACLSICFGLWRYRRRRRDVPSQGIFKCLTAFLLALGCTRGIAILSIWYPLQGIDAIASAATGMLSLATACLLVRAAPAVANLPSPKQLAAAQQALSLQIAERRRAEAELQRLNDERLARGARS